jgi:hypothetical protein
MLAATAIKEMYAMRLHLSTELRGYLISDFGNLGGVCFSFSSLLWISFREIQKLRTLKTRSSWKGVSNFSFLESSNFLIS